MSERTAHQLATDYAVEFHATAEVEGGTTATLIKCIITFGAPNTPDYRSNISKAKGLLDEIEKLAPGASTTMRGSQMIINDILGVPQPRPPPARPAGAPLTEKYELTCPKGTIPEDAPTSGALNLAPGVKATWKVHK